MTEAPAAASSSSCSLASVSVTLSTTSPVASSPRSRASVLDPAVHDVLILGGRRGRAFPHVARRRVALGDVVGGEQHALPGRDEVVCDARIYENTGEAADGVSSLKSVP